MKRRDLLLGALGSPVISLPIIVIAGVDVGFNKLIVTIKNPIKVNSKGLITRNSLCVFVDYSLKNDSKNYISYSNEFIISGN